jgi:Domain of unknown function (DUF4333)
MRCLFALAVLLVLAAALAACGETVIDTTKIEEQSMSDLEKNLPARLEAGKQGEELSKELGITADEKISSVDCPSDVEVKTGATFTCTVTFANGREAEEAFRIRDQDANVTQVSFGPKKPGG